MVVYPNSGEGGTPKGDAGRGGRGSRRRTTQVAWMCSGCRSGPRDGRVLPGGPGGDRGGGARGARLSVIRRQPVPNPPPFSPDDQPGHPRADHPGATGPDTAPIPPRYRARIRPDDHPNHPVGARGLRGLGGGGDGPTRELPGHRTTRSPKGGDRCSSRTRGDGGVRPGRRARHRYRPVGPAGNGTRCRSQRGRGTRSGSGDAGPAARRPRRGHPRRRGPGLPRAAGWSSPSPPPASSAGSASSARTTGAS